MKISYAQLENVPTKVLYEANLKTMNPNSLLKKEVNPEMFDELLDSHGYDPSVSVAAFDEDTGECVGMVLNGIRKDRRNTAYDTMIGLVLNEGGYVTYPYEVLKPVEDYVKTLNWRVTNVNCMGDGSGYSFPFEEQEDSFVDGETLLSMLQKHPKIQWVWGALSGFTKDIPWDEIRKNPIEDLFVRQPYLENTLHHLEPGSVFEMIAFDSTDTFVLIDDPDVADRMLAAFPKAGSLEGYVFETET